MIVEENFFHEMVDLHRTRNATLTVLLKKPDPSPETVKKSSTDDLSHLIGLNAEGRLIYYSLVADLEDTVNIKKDILRR